LLVFTRIAFYSALSSPLKIKTESLKRQWHPYCLAVAGGWEAAGEMAKATLDLPVESARLDATTQDATAAARRRVLWLSTAAFTLLFNVWLMLGVLSIPIRQDLGLSDSQLEWLMAVAILSGALFRLNFGIWADRYGGRKVTGLLLLGAAIPTFLFSHAASYTQMLVCAALFGLAGNGFSAGIAWNSAWFPSRLQGQALGVFGAGNVGAAGTKLLVVMAPGVLALAPAAGYWGGVIPGQWRFIPALYAFLLVIMGLAILLACPTPDRKPARGRPLGDMLKPLRHARVWRFGLYYVVVFGAYVALSGWLPKFYIDTYGVPLSTAALLTATFIVPASLLRPVGGYLADRWGPRVVTYAVFIIMAIALLALSMPSGKFVADAHGPDGELITFTCKLNLWPFTALMFVLGCGMGIGKASVYKYIPDYFPEDVGTVGGLVGMLGALGGFFLPPALGFVARWSSIPQFAFLTLLGLTLCSLAWLHLAVLRLRTSRSLLDNEGRLPAEYTAASPL
jgi:NNP family nitrate/nitrite transporter-like MFS transporter